MATIYTHRDSNIRKTWFLMTGFFVFIVGIGWFVSGWLEMQVILIVAIILSIAMSFGSYWWSDKLVLKMAHASPADKDQYPELYDIVENLTITSGLPLPRLYIIEEQAPNAFATGRNPAHGVIGVTTGLLDILDKNELEGVMAHEISHIGNRDMLISTIVVVFAGMIVYLSNIMFHSFLFSGDRREGWHLIVGFVVVFIASIFATIIRMSISRKREFLADASGALLTRYPDGLASALQKISQDTTRMRTANNATAHLFFENPFKADKKGNKVSFMNRLFMTHPPVEERIEALMGTKRKEY